MSTHREGDSCRFLYEGLFSKTLPPGGGADVRGLWRAPRLLQRVPPLRQGRCNGHEHIRLLATCSCAFAFNHASVPSYFMSHMISCHVWVRVVYQCIV
jgi:hypothetical protein